MINQNPPIPHSKYKNKQTNKQKPNYFQSIHPSPFQTQPLPAFSEPAMPTLFTFLGLDRRIKHL
ncbi:hypothetical protein ACQP3J_31865, partial [Escherichia coli]